MILGITDYNVHKDIFSRYVDLISLQGDL
jgi:hypothetical protein